MIKIKEVRLEKGLKQKWVARKAGLSVTSLCQIESGKQNPKIETLKRIADAMGCSIDELIA